MTPDHSFLARCTVNAAALWLASTIVPGIQVPVQTTTCLVILLTFAVTYELVRPLLSFLTLPLALVLVIPAKIAVYMFILTATVAATQFWGAPLAVNGFLTIFWTAVAVSLIRLLLTESVRLYETRQTLRRQRKWIQELRQATTWLTEQVDNWQRIVEERQRVLREQQAWIEELQVAKAWLIGQLASHSGMDRIRRN